MNGLHVVSRRPAGCQVTSNSPRSRRCGSRAGNALGAYSARLAVDSPQCVPPTAAPSPPTACGDVPPGVQEPVRCLGHGGPGRDGLWPRRAESAVGLILPRSLLRACSVTQSVLANVGKRWQTVNMQASKGIRSESRGGTHAPRRSPRSTRAPTRSSAWSWPASSSSSGPDRERRPIGADRLRTTGRHTRAPGPG